MRRLGSAGAGRGTAMGALGVVVASALGACSGAAPSPRGDAVLRRLERACRSGDYDACYDAGLRQEQRPLDAAARARLGDLYERACRAGRWGACLRLGRLYEQGTLSAPRATPDLGKLCASVRGGEVPREAPCTAAILYARACDGGLGEACRRVGELVAGGALGGPDASAAAVGARWLSRACEAGDAEGCTAVGRRHLDAEGGARDVVRAAIALEVGCLHGGGQACELFADLHARGVGVDPDVARAAVLFRKACTLGRPTSCTSLARLLARGRVVEPDAAQARQLGERACQGGDADGCVVAATTLEVALGSDQAEIQQAYARAARAYDERCRAGDHAACGRLGALVRRGRGVAADEARGRALERQACLAGNGDACAAIAREAGAGVSLGDLPLERACGRGHGEACFLFGRSMDASGTPPAHALGCVHGHAGACNATALGFFPPADAEMAQLERACALADAPGCHHLGLALELPGSAQDAERALGLHERSCAWGWGPACGRLAQIFRTGDGVSVDVARAAELGRRGCALGAARACFEVGVALAQPGPAGEPPASLADGHTLLVRACEHGEVAACGWLAAEALRSAGSDRARALEVLGRSCDRDDPRSCLTLAEALLGRLGARPRPLALTPPADRERARQALRRAATLAERRCHEALGVCHDGARVLVERRWETFDGAPALAVVRTPACGLALERDCALGREALERSCRLLDRAQCERARTLEGELARRGLGAPPQSRTLTGRAAPDGLSTRP